MDWSHPVRGIKIEPTGAPIPAEPGVYVWQRVLSLQPEAVVDSDLFFHWVASAVETPFLRTGHLRVAERAPSRVSVRAGFVEIDSVSVGHGSLTGEKRDSLRAHLTTSKGRRELYKLLHTSALRFGPVLYVGESKDLRTRMSEHVSSNSPYRARLADLRLDLEDTTVTYLPLPASSNETRQMIEQLLTHLLLAPLTYRPG